MDYKDFEGKGEASGKGNVGYWWKEKDPTDRANLLVSAAEELKEKANPRSQGNLRAAMFYSASDSASFEIRDYTSLANKPGNKISLNVITSCIDTLSAKIAKTRPRPSFLTDGGNYHQQRGARRLDKFCRGLFYETKYYEHAREVFRDALVFDIGALKVYLDDSNRVVFERVFPEELFVDDADAIYGKPRQLMQRKYVQKEVLLAEFGKDEVTKAAIEAATPPPDAFNRGFGDCVEVWEAWHLPSGKGAKDGHHVIAIAGAELFHEPWNKDYFPFAFLRFSKRVRGFWGQGLAERLTGIQLEINRLLRSISEQLRRKGRGRIFVQKGSGTPKTHFTNAIGDILEYGGTTPPVVDNGNAVASEEFMQLDRLYQKAYQEAGISELSAGAKKPSGLDAAVAIREFNDVESERFSLLGKDWEQLAMDATEIAVDMIDARAGAGYKVKVPYKNRCEYVDWSDVDLKRDSFVMQMFPVSSLPQTPAYRMQRVKEMIDSGFIDKTTGMRLLDFPDIEAETSLALSAIDDVDATIGDILDLDSPKFTPPDEMTNLELMITRATASYLRAKHQEGVGQDRLDLLIKLIDSCKAILVPPQPPMPAGAPAGPAGPAGPMDPAMAGAPMPPAGGPNVTGGIDINVAGGSPAMPAVPPLIQ